jgi:IMP dehydrogenase
MTARPLVTASVGIDLEAAKVLLQKHRIEKLPLVDAEGTLKGLITVKDIQKARDFPHAAVDSQGRLLVGAAVGVGDDLEERLQLMVAEELDLVIVDTAHGHSAGVVRAIERIRGAWPDLPVIAGNVVTSAGAQALIQAGASAIKVGVGAGSICTTRVISGAGKPQLSAIYHCAKVARAAGIPVIADGGIKFSGDIVKALAVGGDVVMLGGLLAGLEESPGEVVLYEGRHYKQYRGMGSIAAMKGYGRDRYASAQSQLGKLVPEGIEGRVPYKGGLHDYVYQLVGGLRSGMGYAGAANLEELRAKCELTRVTGAGLIESHPHDVIITKEAPNYQITDG